MSKLLDEAIEQLRDLPKEEQNAAADVIFAYVSSDERRYHLRPRQAREVRRIKKALRKETTRLATDEEVSSVKNNVGRMIAYAV
jgi:hypothetical protein